MPASPGATDRHSLLPGGGVADLLLLDKRAPQRGAHPSGSHGIGGAEGACGDELLLAGFKEQHLLFSLQPVKHYPYLMGDGEQAREAAAWMRLPRALGTGERRPDGEVF